MGRQGDGVWAGWFFINLFGGQEGDGWLTALSVSAFDLAAFGPTMLWGFFVNIRFFGCCGWRFRPYGGSLLANAPKVTKRSGPLRSAPRCGSAFLRSGIYPGASPTVCFAAPPLDACGFAARSLRSHPRINPSTQPSDGAGTSRAVLELTLIVLSGEGRAVGFWFLLGLLTSALSRGSGGQHRSFSKAEFTSVFHVGVPPPNTSVSPLSLWERARVRGLLRLFKSQQPNRILPTMFSGCPSEARSLVFGCRCQFSEQAWKPDFK